MTQGKTNSVVGGEAHYTIIHAHIPDGNGWICKFVSEGTTHEVTVSNEEAFWDTNLAVGQTWTVSIKNHSEIPSQTVTITAIDKAYEVILEAPMLTINLSLKGAKGDIIKVYNSANVLLTTCVFGSSAITGSCSVQIASAGDTLKFESQIAKDTTSGTTAYYKTQTYTASGSYTVNVYPDGAVYWYGNVLYAWNTSKNRNSEGSRITQVLPSITQNTNHMVFSQTSGNGTAYVSNDFNTSLYTKMKVIIVSASSASSSQWKAVILGMTNNFVDGYAMNPAHYIIDGNQSAITGMVTINIASLTDTRKIVLSMNPIEIGNTVVSVSSLWFE